MTNKVLVNSKKLHNAFSFLPIGSMLSKCLKKAGSSWHVKPSLLTIVQASSAIRTSTIISCCRLMTLCARSIIVICGARTSQVAYRQGVKFRQSSHPHLLTSRLDVFFTHSLPVTTWLLFAIDNYFSVAIITHKYRKQEFFRVKGEKSIRVRRGELPFANGRHGHNCK